MSLPRLEGAADRTEAGSALGGELLGHGPLVQDDLAVAGPGSQDGPRAPDPRRARVAGRAEPVVLRSPRGARQHAGVGGAVGGGPQHLLHEQGIPADHRGGQAVAHPLAGLQHPGELVGGVGDDHLHRTEDLTRHVAPVFLGQGLPDGDLHRGGLDGAVALRDLVALQRLPAKEQLRPGDLAQALHVLQHLGGRPGQDGTHGQVLQLPARREAGQTADEPGVIPVLVHEQDGLGRALLPAGRVGVLVALQRHGLHPLRQEAVVGVRAQDLPVEPGIFQPDATVHDPGHFLRHVGRAGELDQPDAVLGRFQELAHGPPVAADHVHVLHGEAAGVQQAQELLHHHRHLGVHLQQDLVAHEQGTHDLQRGDLQGEVERADHHHRPERPAVAPRLLTLTVPGDAEALRQEADLVAAEVLEEHPRDHDLTLGLGVRLGHAAHDQPGEEVLHLGLEHGRTDPRTHLAEHPVPLHVVERVVQPVAGALRQALREEVEVVRAGLVDGEQRPAVQRVRDHPGVDEIHPLAGQEAPDQGGLVERRGLESCECRSHVNKSSEA